MNTDKNEKEINDLVRVAQENRDNDAIMKLLKKLQPFRFSMARKFSNKGVEFDDIVQQIDLKLIEAIYDYDESKDPSALRHLTSKVRNGIWNFYRKEMNYFDKDRQFISLDNIACSNESNHHNGATFISNGYDFIESYDFDEDAIIENIAIREELDKLTAHQKEILFMCFIDDKTQYDIAEELNINQSSVSRAKKRGIKSIRESINPSDEQDDIS